MTLIEAIKSGKRFRRKGTDRLNPKYPKPGDSFVPMDLLVAHFSMEDVLANDWEVEEKAVTITLSDLRAAWDRATSNVCEFEVTSFSLVAKELGLE